MIYQLTGEPAVPEADPFKGTIPMFCPDCDMTYYRKLEKQGDSCDFCGSTDIQVTTHEHIIELSENSLILEPGYYKVR